jgi:hypothetical protein
MGSFFAELNVDSILASIETQRAAIIVNWNGQNPDLMNPAMWARVESSVATLGQDVQKLTFALGIARTRP